MKMKKLLPFLMVLLLGQSFFSCRSGEPFLFTGTNPEALSKVKAKPAPATGVAATTITMAEPAAVMPAVKPAPVLEANAAASPVITRNKTAPVAKVPAVAPRLSPVNQATSVAASPELTRAREKLASLTKAEKKALKRDIRQALAQQADVDLVLLIILAILLPPLAVGLKEGITNRFWISLLLTILFFVPGVIYALLVVTDSI
jgi:uncharacterized membrane protein YqaE (UPF0057 family)